MGCGISYCYMFNAISNINKTLKLTNTELTVIRVALDELRTENVALKFDVKELQSEDDAIKDEVHFIEQKNFENHLMIFGIPPLEWEPLQKRVYEILAVYDITFKLSYVDEIFQIKAENSSPVVVKFKYKRFKNLSIKNKRAIGPVKTSQLPDYKEGDPVHEILINHRFTKYYQSMWKRTRKIARQKGYNYVWFTNNYIYARESDDSKVYRCYNSKDLATLEKAPHSASPNKDKILDVPLNEKVAPIGRQSVVSIKLNIFESSNSLNSTTTQSTASAGGEIIIQDHANLIKNLNSKTQTKLEKCLATALAIALKVAHPNVKTSNTDPKDTRILGMYNQKDLTKLQNCLLSAVSIAMEVPDPTINMTDAAKICIAGEESAEIENLAVENEEEDEVIIVEIGGESGGETGGLEYYPVK